MNVLWNTLFSLSLWVIGIQCLMEWNSTPKDHIARILSTDTDIMLVIDNGYDLYERNKDEVRDRLERYYWRHYRRCTPLPQGPPPSYFFQEEGECEEYAS